MGEREGEKKGVRTKGEGARKVGERAEGQGRKHRGRVESEQEEQEETYTPQADLTGPGLLTQHRQTTGETQNITQSFSRRSQPTKQKTRNKRPKQSGSQAAIG